MITAVCNQKGGVGKTTLATNLAAELTSDGHVLLIDADPQGNATTVLGVEVGPQTITLNDVLAAIAAGTNLDVVNAAIASASGDWGDVKAIPSDRLLASRETDTSLGRETRLSTALRCITEYAHIVIDCPPSLSMLTTNALVAADQALIVSTARETSVDGVAEMASTIAAVRSHYNPRLTLAGLAVNAYRSDRTDRRAWLNQLNEYYGDYVIHPPLPEREAIAAAGTDHRPIPNIDDAVRQGLTAILNTINQKA